jgi:hypothetical protein
MSAGEWLKQHKKAVAIGAAGFIGLIVLLRKSSGGGSSASSSGDGLQVAQLQAQQNLAQAQVQAQQNTQVINAQTEVDQTNAELQGQQNELVTGLAQTLSTNGTQASLEQEQLEAEINQQQTYDSLLGPGINTALATAVKGGNKNSETGLNELALLLNEENAGGLSSFNAGTTTAPSTEQELFGLLEGGAGGGGSEGLLAALGL